VISKIWLTEWRKKKPNFKFHEGNLYPAPDSPPFRYDFICEHGDLKNNLESAVWISKPVNAFFLTWQRFDFLCSLYGPIESFSDYHDSCPICAVISAQKEDIKEDLAVERRQFKYLSSSIAKDFIVGEDYYLVSSGMLWYWFSFLLVFRNAWITRQSLQDKPVVDNSSLLCQHGDFVFDLNCKVDKESNSYILVPKDEWTKLLSKFGGGPELIATYDRENRKEHWHMSRPVCSSCRECRYESVIFFWKTSLLDYRIATIFVKQLGEWKAEEDPIEISSDDEVKVKRIKIDETGRRQSQRITNSINRVYEVQIEPETTVRQLKLKVT